MDSLPPLPARAVAAWRRGGPRYVWHKALRRCLGRWPSWKRRILYRNPRVYWTLRGGDDYFREQEGQPSRSDRARWLAERIARYAPASVLEIGCGYGKQLRELDARLPGVPLFGLDFSPTQLAFARRHLDGLGGVSLCLGDGQRLPFPDSSFDLVLTSAVILHNAPEVAERIRLEAIRVARRWVAHNEDTDESYNRFGYDTAAWYRGAGIRLAECGPIPVGSADEIARSQFCVAAL
ncbi:class I SAM-dependent methyltransferase [Tautonia sociabilis]|uniref:Class I SAM-dependent methyltransferase n=1 Tax=Tautonia sociabilis TaxID=2080755 RepID=A0A432MHZ1_9BACT|nr:class I SAM-dependent methyltransferase [Tautonia sociabilis]